MICKLPFLKIYFSQTLTNVRQDLTIAMSMLIVQTPMEVFRVYVRLVLMEMARSAKVRSRPLVKDV